MIKEKCSPYLTASDVSPRTKKQSRSEVYALTKERKTVMEQLQLMRIRIKQLEREEQRARVKSLKADTLAENILERRVEKHVKQEYNTKLRKIKEKEINDLKERNKEMREGIRNTIAAKKGALIEVNKQKAKDVKDVKVKAKQEVKERGRSASTARRQSPQHSRFETSVQNSSKIEEEKQKTTMAIREINLLEEMEKALIEKLKMAYDEQKLAEEKVVYLINHPDIRSKKGLTEGKEVLNKSIG